ncbi:MAG: DNA translocase FtsK [Treponema sp.]|nr:DNA translocase FtsK [Treponema sp.]
MKHNSKEHVASVAAGVILFFFAAVFAIGLLLKILDFGTGEEGGSILYKLGDILLGAYGFCGMLIPIFFAVAGAFCFDSRWSVTKAACLFVSVLPFMTLVFAEKIIRDVLSYDTSSVAFVKITMTSVVTLLLIAAEYLLAVILAGRIQQRLDKKKKSRVSGNTASEDTISFDDDLSEFDIDDELDDEDEAYESHGEKYIEDYPDDRYETEEYDADEYDEQDSDDGEDEPGVESERTVVMEEEDDDNGSEFQAPTIADNFFGDEKKTVIAEPEEQTESDEEIFNETEHTLKEKIGGAVAGIFDKIKARVQDMAEFSKKQDEEDRKAAEIQEQKKDQEIRSVVDINDFFKKPAERTVYSESEPEEEKTPAHNVLTGDDTYRRPEIEDEKKHNPFLSVETPVEETFEIEESLDSSQGDETIREFEQGNLEYNEADFVNPFATITEDDSIEIETSGTIDQDETPLEMSDLQIDESETEKNRREVFQHTEDLYSAEPVEEDVAEEEEEQKPTFTPSRKRTAEEEEELYAKIRESMRSAPKPEPKPQTENVTVTIGDNLDSIFARIDADVKAEVQQKPRYEIARAQEENQVEKAEEAPVEFTPEQRASRNQGILVDLEETKPAPDYMEESVTRTEHAEEKAQGSGFAIDPLKNLHDFKTEEKKAPEEKKVRHGLLARTESFATGEKWPTEESEPKKDSATDTDSSVESSPVRIDDVYSDDEIEDTVSPSYSYDDKIYIDESEDDLDANLDDDSDSVEEEKPVVRKPVYIQKPAAPYKIPTTLLTAYEDNPYWIIDQETENAAQNLKQTLAEFKIEAEVTGIQKGPVVTMFEILPAPGVKLNRIVALQDNIALRLAASSVRIVAPIPGKHAVGIEVPNKSRAIISIRECLEQERPEWKKMGVPVVLGKDIQGNTQLMDLVKTPHLLIAGATGAGKSVCVNSIILSILFKRSPRECKMILIDPKIVELKLYNDIPHLLTPVITEPKKAMQALQYCLCEMERRYSLLDNMSVRDITSYNRKIEEKKMAAEHLPYLIVIIDEFADLMATTGKQLEGVLARLAAMSRAVGIHLVLATQRPSIDVITGLIKANIPSRIAFMVASKMDSRIILDQVGAEKLLGKGDMLYTSATDPFPTRIQGTFVSDQEVENVVNAVKEWGEPEYIDDEIFVDDDEEEGDDAMSMFNPDGDDPLYEKALDIVVQAGKASASYIQRRLKIGYNRAARLVEEMEERGIVGPANGSKPRELIHIP